MKLRQFVGIFFPLLFLFLQTASAAEPKGDISAKVEVDRAFATIGDRVNLRVTVKHTPDISVLALNAGDALRDFEIKEVKDFSSKEGRYVSEGKNYVIVSYELGDYVIAPLVIQYRVGQGEVRELMTNRLYLTVESVDKKKDPESDIRGVKGVFGIRTAAWLWLVGIVLACGAAVLGAWYFIKRPQLGLKSEEPPLSPHDEAYQALNRLRHSDLIRKGQVKQYFFQMSEILRRYFERRYEIRALESTTYEVLEELKQRESAANLTLIRDVLSFCDLVKFAKYEPPATEILQVSNQARLVIDQTKRVEETTVSEPAGA